MMMMMMMMMMMIATGYDTNYNLRVCPPLDEVMAGVEENQNPEEAMLRKFFQGSRLV